MCVGFLPLVVSDKRELKTVCPRETCKIKPHYERLILNAGL